MLDVHAQRAQCLACAWPSDASTSAYLEQCAVRSAHDQRALLSKKFIRLKIQRMSRMWTSIHIREHFSALSHDKASQRPITCADRERARAGIPKLRERTNSCGLAHRPTSRPMRSPDHASTTATPNRGQRASNSRGNTYPNHSCPRANLLGHRARTEASKRTTTTARTETH
jgi:hypothetical protein